MDKTNDLVDFETIYKKLIDQKNLIYCRFGQCISSKSYIKPRWSYHTVQGLCQLLMVRLFSNTVICIDCRLKK